MAGPEQVSSAHKRAGVGRSDPTGAASGRLLYAFLLFQFACQTALLVAGAGTARTLLRVAVFAPSLLLLALPAAKRSHPDRWLIQMVLGITALGLLHPKLNSPVAGAAHVLLTLAIWGPVFWVPKFTVTPAILTRLVTLIWGFSAASAAVGVLQVYNPARFAPDPEFVRQMGGTSADGLMFQLADGTTMFRPAGLSDSPGGAALAGMFVVVTGLAVAGAARNVLLRLATIPTAAIGIFCLFICQVRSLLILTVLSIIGMTLLLFLTGRVGRAAVVLAVSGLVLAGGFGWSVSVGGDAVLDRFATLGEGSAGEVYYKNRGVFLEDTVYLLLPEYPFGAGLGRWGMMHVYFGDPANPDSPALWAEIQPTAWVYDGGFLLLAAGYAAMLALVWRSVKVAFSARTTELADLAATVAALNVGVVFTTFGAHVFVAQSGMQFCLLNAALYVAAAGGRRHG